MANIITVTALNRYVRSLLESDAVLTDVAIRGEVQNFVHHRSGHFYFSLKDETCSVKAVMFRSNAARLSFEPENGMSVVVRCRVSLYERDGAFQVYVEDLFPDGLGAAQMAFEQLKARLAKEGLFAPEKKKPLPAFPHRIGLVTSKSGAALHDILSVAQRRWPAARFLLAHAGVQGREAEDELAGAVQRLDAEGQVDVIIVARGGGSREDLWVFNGEKLARTVYACRTPVVSAVGHEIDYTILDFVADLRAATPTAAAELVLPDGPALRAQVVQLREKARALVLRRLQMCYNEYHALSSLSAYARLPRRVERAQQQLAAAKETLRGAVDRSAAQKSEQLSRAAALLDSLSPHRTLSRGYCAALKDGRAVRLREELSQGDRLTLLFSGFGARCTVDKITEGSLPDEEKTEL